MFDRTQSTRDRRPSTQNGGTITQHGERSNPRRQPADLVQAVGSTTGLQPWRRVFHCLTGTTVVVLVELGGMARPTVLALLAAGTIAALALDWVRLTRPNVNLAFFKFFRTLASPRETRKIASSTWYAVGVFLVFLLAPREMFAPAVLVTAFADPAASIAGRLAGKHHFGSKSIDGSSAFFLVAASVMAPFVGIVPALAAAVVVTVLEAAPLGMDDNLATPLAAAGVIWAAETVFGLS